MKREMEEGIEKGREALKRGRMEVIELSDSNDEGSAGGKGKGKGREDAFGAFGAFGVELSVRGEREG